MVAALAAYAAKAERRIPFAIRLGLGLLLVGASGALWAEAPASAFAAAQLEFAQSELDRAKAALQTRDYSLARQLAGQALLDARLAWGMTESTFVRTGAAEVARRAERLSAQGLLSAGIGAAR
ncbi:MAG TPA: hypothetical protein VNU96_14875 [Burkholderiales bacterium]|jgi:hypothetical protein|nr:hypothetical protein [Burkholderiales bacterium]HXJ50617.1 hypothetical protein [Burkholderiales bacterium]